MPMHHATHHSTSPKEHHRNYGVVFSFWDRLFNTLNTTQPKEFGLKNIKQQNTLETILFAYRKNSVIVIFLLVFIILVVSSVLLSK